MARDSDLTGRHLGGFEILRLLGKGGMGQVFLARETALDRMVALKVIRESLADDEALVERFRREARAAARLSHPNIVHIHSVGEQDGLSYIAMEYVEGASLEGHLRKQGALPWQNAMNICGQVAAALQCAHANGTIHRDIKPANVLIDKQGRVKVTDFGVAKLLQSRTNLTQEGMLVGTPQYMSPEQCGIGEIGPASDLFSLGVMTYEMLTGKLPFEAKTPAGLVRQITTEDPPPLLDLAPQTPPAVHLVVCGMLRREQEQRYHSTPALLEDLRLIASGKEPVHIPSITPKTESGAPPPIAGENAPFSAIHLPRPPKKSRKRLYIILVAVIFFVVFLSGRNRGNRNIQQEPVPPPLTDSSGQPGVIPLQPMVPPESPAAAQPLLPGVPGGSPQDIFKRFDRNQDGVLRSEELPPMLRQTLMRADSNDDGAITLEELRTAHDRMKNNGAGPGARRNR